MKSHFLSPFLSRKLGGIHEIMKGLSRELLLNGVEVEAFGLEDEFSVQDMTGWGNVPTHFFSVYGPRSFGYSRALKAAILHSDAEILHLHTLWMYPSLIALDWVKIKKRPFMVTVNGMLEPWALRNSAWKKRIVSLLYERKMLSSATCLHANTEKEYTDIRSLGFKTPVVIIPNGVDLPVESVKPDGEIRTLLYVGRIHPKKGLVNALRSFKMALDARRSTLDSTPWRLVIAGWDQGGHEAELIKLCGELCLRVEWRGTKIDGQENGTEVVFLGPAFGMEKEALFRSADAFILPSLSEGLPMAVLEAWSYSLPVVMTPECNLSDGFEFGAAIKTSTSVNGLSNGLKELFSMTDNELKMMGANGRNLVENCYTWKKVAGQMKEVYEWMLGGSEPSSLIY